MITCDTKDEIDLLNSFADVALKAGGIQNKLVVDKLLSLIKLKVDKEKEAKKV